MSTHPIERAPSASSFRPESALGTAFGRVGRIFGTGLSFVVFGTTALLLAVVVIPLGSLAGGDLRQKQTRVQRMIHHAYQLFLGMMELLGLHRTEWIGAEKLGTSGPRLIVANHPTLIDIIQLIARLPQADCVIGDRYARSPLLGPAAARAGYITNLEGPAVVDECVERLRAGRTIVLFPEGTRSSPTGLHRFQRGAAHIALRAGVPLVPVVIACVPRMLRKGQPWWDVPPRRSQYTIRVLDPVAPEASGASAAIAARRLTESLRERIEERLDRGALG